MVPEDFQARLEGIWHAGLVFNALPERGVLPIGETVVGNYEVHNIRIEFPDVRIVPVNDLLIVKASVEHGCGHFYSDLGNRQACGFQRLNESTSEANGNAVLDPRAW
jgi:hypothetical protein